MLLRVLGLGFGLGRLESSTRQMIPRTARWTRPFGDADAVGILMVVAIARRRRRRDCGRGRGCAGIMKIKLVHDQGQLQSEMH